ncbi:hypothetical protein SAMN04487891_102244 [Flagellimonas taeanensis]|uniref:DUF6602 domain-containing protein n=1 Tax=Flagellimonas taeanensis TaxID=1005926 RepID=A0A1M6RYF7_9FLAO|nr:DUF6602 domain-containing protein [Allomuricauda taeanensis]SFB77089.1 hypothetical protein SAMN04487891_102244 [Allomuricauda taeanensis]SHK37483.1 hypothetical protein SAMN05216293_0923 [Allomuricauda taeanensis]
MPNDFYKKILNDRIEDFLSQSKSADLMNHLGLRGEMRESGLGKLIEDLLPIDWGVGSGKIIDSNNCQSSETDLLIYYKKVLPPIFFRRDKGIFPIESCGFAFEVKTKSSAREVKSTISKFDKLKRMEIIKPWSEDTPEYKIKPIRVYFAIDSDLKKGDELNRYLELDSNHRDEPTIQIICVVGRGLWVYYNKENLGLSVKGIWRHYANEGNNEELLILLSIIINQLTSIVTFGSLDMKKYLLEAF